MRGNCFSVGTGTRQSVSLKDEAYYVVNMYLENLEELINRGIVDWPIDITPLTAHHCKITDERIPEEWFRPEERYCDGCYPKEMRP